MAAGVAANLSTDALRGGAGGYQIIGGKSYPMYSPEWYAAQRQNNVDVSGAAGTAAGTYTKNAATASGLLASPSLTALDGGAGPTGASGAAGAPGGAPGAAGTGVSGGTPAKIPQVQAPDTTAATSQAFARAKDTAGNLSRASLDALNGELGSQGMLGGGAQSQGAADILARATNTLGNEATNETNKTVDLNADFAKTGYEGGITQRGQDIQQQEAAASLAQSKQLSEEQLAQQRLLAILAGLNGNPASTPAGAASAGLY